MTEIIGMYELLDALEEALKSADLAKRRKLAETIRAYEKDLPDEFYWAVGAQSPALLHNLMSSIDATCRPISRSKAGGPEARRECMTNFASAAAPCALLRKQNRN